MYRIILASSSPRRKELLSQLKIPFEVITQETDESISPTLSPDTVVETLSNRKAAAVLNFLSNVNNTIIISADTVVAHKNKILGKPKTEEEAFLMLSSLQNDFHYVYTGLTVIVSDNNSNSKTITCSEKSKVFFCSLSDDEIKKYISTGEPMDKAGAYGIQGQAGKFIERIEGDYYNIVGLPLNCFYKIIRKYIF